MKVIVTIPTYNEADNIDPLLDALLALDPSVEVLVVDDSSPDGTGQRVHERQKRESRVHLIVRSGPRGRGTAGVVGFKEALRQGAEGVIEMDADFSHRPEDVPRLIAAAETDGVDVVIGSRKITGGEEEGRTALRKWITRLAGAYIRWWLGLPVKDPTSGFRFFRSRVLKTIPLDRLRSTGPSIVQEVLYQVCRHGFSVAEIPVIFPDRRKGQSTFSPRVAFQSLVAVPMIRLRGKRTSKKEAE